MKNRILQEIAEYAREKLKNQYGYYGEMSGAEMIVLSSDDRAGNDIKITITAKPE